MIRLVAFDLDGTLTRGRTCLETAADAFGFADRMPVWQRSRTEQEIATARREAWELLRGHDIAPLAAIPLAPGAVEEKEKLGLRSLMTEPVAGPAVIDRSIAPSTVQARETMALCFPAPSVARTCKTCRPSGRLKTANGEAQS